MDTTHEVWMRNFEQGSDAIPESWRVTIEGSQWILPEHGDDPVVKMHRELALVGFARGWL